MSVTLPPKPTRSRRSFAVPGLSTDPEKRSVQVGVIGTILVHVLLYLLAPWLLRIGAKPAPFVPSPTPPAFNIEMPEDIAVPPPKPKEKQPFKFVETNPDAPDNVPDKTDNFAAKNEQAAQEKPDPKNHSDNPAMDGQKDIHSTQIVDGRLEKPVQREQAEVPETPPTEPVVAVPKTEQNPLSGFEKNIGEAENAIGSNVAKFAPRSKDVPQKVEGQKDAPLIQGASAMTPQIDPRRPQPRQSIVKSILTRPAIFEENKIGTDNVGIIGHNAKWSAYGQYLQKMVEAIDSQWRRLLDESKTYPASGTSVIVTFILNSEGKVKILTVEGDKAGQAASVTCATAIGDRAPYGLWTDDMIALLGTEDKMTFQFFYQ